MESMKVYQKWEDMTVYLYVSMKLYPKSERFTLAADTTHAAIDAGTAITRATSMSGESARRKEVERADASIAQLKILVRIGMKLGFLPMKKYELLSGMLTEIGKMIGGWFKAIRQ